MTFQNLTAGEPASVDRLDDATVLSALQELTEELRNRLPEDQRRAVATAEDARLALAAWLGGSTPQLVGDTRPLDRDAALAASRELLRAAVEDPGTADLAQDLVADPPENEQMALAGGLEVLIVVAALVTLLQTRVNVRVERKDGRSDFTVEVGKEAAESSLVEQLVGIAKGLFLP
ncbi:hypothetical protein NUM3379_41320 [Kineococcus sp. NUM-3379]